MIHVMIFWVVMLCNDVVVGYQHFRGPCCLPHLGDFTLEDQL